MVQNLKTNQNKVLFKLQYLTTWGMKLNFWLWLVFHKSCKYQMGWSDKHDMPKVITNSELVLSQEWVSFFACGKESKEVTNLFNYLKWVWLEVPKVIQNNRLEWT